MRGGWLGRRHRRGGGRKRRRGRCQSRAPPARPIACPRHGQIGRARRCPSASTWTRWIPLQHRLRTSPSRLRPNTCRRPILTRPGRPRPARGASVMRPTTWGAFEARVRQLIAGNPLLVEVIEALLKVWRSTGEQLVTLHRRVLRLAQTDETCRRLMTVPGVGAVTAAAFLATVDDPERFRRLPPSPASTTRDASPSAAMGSCAATCSKPPMC